MVWLSAVRNGQRVVVVLNGMKSIKQRANESRRLMDLIFREYQTCNFFNKVNQLIEQCLIGTAPQIDLVLEEPLKMLLSRKERQAIEISVQWLDPVPAQSGSEINWHFGYQFT